MSIEDRLRAIEDRTAILDLEADYAASWDFGNAQAWAALFTADGVFEMEAAGAMPHTIFTGHEQLAAFCKTISSKWTGLHYMHPPRLRITEDSATSLIFFEFRHHMRDGNQSRHGMTGGYYETRYARTVEGWRILHRKERAVFEELSNTYAFTHADGDA